MAQHEKPAGPAYRGSGMTTIRGAIVPPISVVAILECWKNRYGNKIAPKADLRTDGNSFEIVYSESWKLHNLKHSFELEVHRVAPESSVVWG